MATVYAATHRNSKRFAQYAQRQRTGRVSLGNRDRRAKILGSDDAQIDVQHEFMRAPVYAFERLFGGGGSA